MIQPKAQTDVNRNPSLLVWLLRLLLAVLLAFGTEILLWPDPPGNSATDWLIKIAAYPALATLLLDLCVRYRARDIYGLMLIIPVYSLLAGLIINPEMTLVSFPNTFVTRVIGGNGVFGLTMFGLFLVLTNGNQQRYRLLLLGYSAWLGFYWGVWVRWTPELTDRITETVTLNTMFAYASGFIIASLLLYAAVVTLSRRSRDIAPADLQLSVIGWGGVTTILIVLLMIRALQETTDALPILASAALITVCWGTLWSQSNPKATSLLHQHVPPTPLQPHWIILAIVIFGGMSILGYELPLLNIGPHGQYSFMEILFAVVGFSWLPLAAAIFSVRAIDRQSRTGQW